ncbi:MAG TPA: DUF2911 domain-containing protein [Chitinophagaceae bacterium]|nr:DUF2911 domain-containing protein [Chitinophagaceae bacterium]
MRKLLLILTPVFFFGCKESGEKPAASDIPPTKIDSQRIKVLPQVNHYTIPDRSPMDMIYFPTDYALLKMRGKTTSLPLMRVIYSRPQKQNRKIFGDLVKYNIPWRLGANEATEIEFFSTATIQDKKINPGRYIVYCIPQDTSWTFVFNSNLYSWGLEQNRQKDLMQFDAPVEKTNMPIEYFTIAFEKVNEKTTDVLFLWDDVKTKLTISF